MEQKRQATRDAYGQALVDLGAKYSNLLVLDADLAAATKTGLFQKAYPDRFFNCGIAEANMMSVAAGLASCGNIVFASSFAMFAAARAFEQVRNSICNPHLNVKIGASHAGISVGEDGASHQCCEDIGLMRTLPGMTIINPADAVEAYAAVCAAAKYQGPVYMRFGRLPVPVIFSSDYRFQWGKGVLLQEGTDVTIIATGLLVERAIAAAEQLQNQGIRARLINLHTIKPIDRDIIAAAARETGAIVTAEEHNIIGGLGSAVAEVVAETCPVPVLRVGVEDVFGCSGPALELLELFGLNAQHIVEKAKQAMELKK